MFLTYCKKATCQQKFGCNWRTKLVCQLSCWFSPKKNKLGAKTYPFWPKCGSLSTIEASTIKRRRKPMKDGIVCSNNNAIEDIGGILNNLLLVVYTSYLVLWKISCVWSPQVPRRNRGLQPMITIQYSINPQREVHFQHLSLVRIWKKATL